MMQSPAPTTTEKPAIKPSVPYELPPEDRPEPPHAPDDLDKFIKRILQPGTIPDPTPQPGGE